VQVNHELAAAACGVGLGAGLQQTQISLREVSPIEGMLLWTALVRYGDVDMVAKCLKQQRLT